MTSYIIPPRLRNSDYTKSAITQDEYLRIAAANDANISAARKAYKSGEVTQPTAIQSATADELLADIGKQESDARNNLIRLGFRDQEAARITADLMNEPDVLRMLNINFPTIDADIKKRFNPRLITPTFFLQYLREYNENLRASRGLDINSSAVIRRPINALINSVAELRRVVPDRGAIDGIVEAVNRSGAVSRDIVANIAALRDIIPTEAQLRAIQAEGNVERMGHIQRILDALADVPTRAEIDRLNRDLRGEMGEVGFNVVRQNQINLRALADALPSQRTIVEIRALLGQLARAPEAPIEEEPEFYDAIAPPAAPTAPARQREPLFPPEEEPIVAEPAPDVAEGRRPIVAQAVRVLTINDVENSSGAELRTWYRDTARYYRDREPIFYRQFLETARNTGLVSSNGSAVQGLLDVEQIREMIIPLIELVDAKEGEITGRGLRNIGQKVANKVMRTIGGELRSKMNPIGLPKPPPLKKIKLGKGLSVKETPTYKEFGKYAIHIPQLEDQDILNVKYRSLGGIPKFKPFPVSDIFRDFMLDVLDGKRPSERVYLQIEPKERKAFEEIAIGAGLWNGLGLKRTTTNEDEEDRKRFEVLKGIYGAGNNSPQVTQELRRLVTKFINEGKMKRQQGLNLLMELSI